MSAPDSGKPFPVHPTDEAAERFVEDADLSDYDFSRFKPARFEFQPKDARLDVRNPTEQLP
ncbi:CopG family antitoxin [Jiella avicenniae]|uniref:BrnA antitoxin family protein n=1 Tax=Jiella avicenniae TaxID=2907202 RepID=A0A9X1P742_9HYPH|nr:CopG family antitoxin [Jiella avicenniae]MCE7030974.1 BrnA antitoxin family protein [Jiella avicenniae]